MRTIFNILVIGFCLSTLVSAQTVDDVLNNYFETIGQEQLLQKTCMTAKGKIVQGGMEIPFVSIQKRPMMIRTEGTFQGMTFLQGYNGEVGWSLNPFMGQTEAAPMTEEQLDQLKLQADFDGPYYNYTEKGYKMEFAGTEEIDDITVNILKLIRPNGDEIITYFDSENFVPLKTKSKTKMQGVETEVETYYSNYKESEGILIPHEIETKVNSQSMMHMVFDAITWEEVTDDSIFDMPAAAPKTEELKEE